MTGKKSIAILMLCHVLPNQINDFISGFDGRSFTFFLHVDRKSTIQSKIRHSEKVHFVPWKRRVDVRWGTYSMVQASLELIDIAMKTSTYDYFWLCSGQDFPQKKAKDIMEFFKRKECNFISFSASENYPINGYKNTRFDKRCEIIYPSWLIGKKKWQRILKKLYIFATGGRGHTFKVFKRSTPLGLKFYFGSQWWCLSRDFIIWMTDYIRERSEICEFFKKTLCPDESFFQTLIMVSPYAKAVEPNLVYTDWSDKNSSPRFLTEMDYDKIKASGKLFARKIDSKKEPKLYRKMIMDFMESK